MSGEHEQIHPLAALGDLRPDDYQIFFDLFTHPKLVPYLPEQAIPKNYEEAQKEIDNLVSKEWQGVGRYWGIYHENMLIGTVGLHTLVARDHSIEISYEIHPDYWGHGIATHAAIYCSVYARLHLLNVNTIKAYTLTDNKPSHRVAEKAGFKRVKVCKNDCFYHGKLIDRLLFELVLREND